MTVENVGLARALLEKAEIADLLNLRVTAQEIAHLGRILVRPLHSQLKGFEAAQEHPRGVRVADRADGVSDHANLIDQPLLPDDTAGDEVAVPADIFGEAVER